MKSTFKYTEIETLKLILMADGRKAFFLDNSQKESVILGSHKGIES